MEGLPIGMPVSPALVCGFVIALRPVISDTKGIFIKLGSLFAWLLHLGRVISSPALLGQTCCAVYGPPCFSLPPWPCV